MGALIAWQDEGLGAGAELSADSEAPGMGALSLLTPQVSDVWRSGPWGATTINLRAAYPEVRMGLRLVVLRAPLDGVLPSAGCGIRITASALSQDGTDALDTGVMQLQMQPHGQFVFLHSGFMARYVRVRLIGTALDSYIQLGRLWIGPALVTRYNARPGATRGVFDAGRTSRSAIGGIRHSLRGATGRRAAFSVEGLTATEADQIHAAARAAGTTGQVFAAPRDDMAQQLGVLGGLTALPEPALGVDWSEATITVEEDL